jgi:hypothetical protein
MLTAALVVLASVMTPSLHQLYFESDLIVIGTVVDRVDRWLRGGGAKTVRSHPSLIPLHCRSRSLWGYEACLVIPRKGHDVQPAPTGEWLACWFDASSRTSADRSAPAGWRFRLKL